MRDGLTVVLIGRPNVGKSTLLNRLAGEDLAIVTAIAGTTRDHVRATVSLDGVPIHLIDTAGLRVAGDKPWGPHNDIGLGYMSEVVSGSMHSGAHIDALAHITIGPEARWYGGSTADLHLGDFGPEHPQRFAK